MKRNQLMVNYRRNIITGGMFFFTVTLQNRRSSLLVTHISFLKNAVQKVKNRHPFQLNAYVILPDHFHMIWTLPNGDSDYSTRMQQIKANFSKQIARSGRTVHKTRHNEYRLWQRRFWEHTIKDNDDLEQHINYIHYNPIKHRCVEHLKDWPYSSFHHFVQNGRLPENWCDTIKLERAKLNFGE